MANTMEVKVPDIGDFKDVPVVEILVAAGARVEKEDPLISLESDKATIEVPAPASGTVKSIELKVGDKVSEGSLILLLEAQTQAPAGAAKAVAAAIAPATPAAPAGPAPAAAPPAATAAAPAPAPASVPAASPAAPASS